MEILQQIWGWSLIYSACAFIAIPMLPKPKSKKEAWFKLFLSGYVGWAWFLLIETPKHFIRKQDLCMNEYKINYEAPPISEVIKTIFIKADNKQAAIDAFNNLDITDSTIVNVNEVN